VFVALSIYPNCAILREAMERIDNIDTF